MEMSLPQWVRLDEGKGLRATWGKSPRYLAGACLILDSLGCWDCGLPADGLHLPLGTCSHSLLLKGGKRSLY